MNETYLLESKYKKVDLDKVVEKQKELNPTQQKTLLKLLKDYEVLFQGKLGAWKGPEISIELKDGVEPFHGKAYQDNSHSHAI